MATVEAGVIEDSVEVEEAVEERVEELAEVEDDTEQVDGVASMKSLWDDSSKLLFQSGYLKVLKQMALSGQLQQYHIRSVCWRLFLGCLPEDQDQWIYCTKLSREHYTEVKNKHLTDPHKVAASLDVTVNNPLSLDDESPWNQFFQDNELKQTINQDVVRTFPDVQFFRQSHIQSTMLDLLFCYCKEHPDLCYRQGMHELLAPILFVLHSEMRDTTDPSLAPELQYIMDPNFIEHDAYTIFSELMEGMQKWYMSTALEADYYRAAKARNNHKKMYHDPRTQKPFEGKEEHTPTSAVSRKLELIHNLLLKKADDMLWLHMRELAIPALTYGIRWIRLLFGREFPLPSVLELWDALFVDGTSLSLVDYICVAMLMHIREVLIEGDYATCMHHLMHFPTVYEVNYLVQRALHLRSPTAFPSPHIWTYHPNRGNTVVVVDTPTNQQPSPQLQTRAGSFQSRASKAKEVLTKQIPKALSRNSQSGPRLEFDSSTTKARSRSPSPKPRRNTHLTPTDEKLFSGTTFATMNDTSSSNSSSSSSKPRGRFKILGDTKSPKVPAEKEMMSNPKVHQETSSNQIEKLTNRLDDVEAKCLYCGGKMESLIDVLQEEITSLSGLEDETENTLLLSLAGLKHVRDLLLNKIPFSGEVSTGWETPKSKPRNPELNRSINTAVKPSVSQLKVIEPSDSDPASTNSTVSTESASEDATTTTTTPTSRTLPIPIPSAGMGMKPDQVSHPLESSGNGISGMKSSIGEDWVNLSVGSHPLVSSSEAND